LREVIPLTKTNKFDSFQSQREILKDGLNPRNENWLDLSNEAKKYEILIQKHFVHNFPKN